MFELKRGTLLREAVAQVIDYASDLDSRSEVELAEHIATRFRCYGVSQNYLTPLREMFMAKFGTESQGE